MEYDELYCTLDVTILADAFLKYRQTIYDNFEIKAGWYFSLPMLSMDIALKYTNVRIETISDPQILVFVENSIRGGFAGGGDCRIIRANNEKVPN